MYAPLRSAALLAVLLATGASAAHAQDAGALATVTGTARDADGRPLPGANVYLSGTTRGASADAQGRYRIQDVAPGEYRLVGSMVGYAADVRPVRLGAGQEAHVDLALSPSVEALRAVAVEATADNLWRRRFARFAKVVLGESDNARATWIVNPEVLDFTSSRGTLSATAAAPLIIENRALGYRLRYDLHAFSDSRHGSHYDGDEVFEEIEPSSVADSLRWAEARERAWRGSLRHLLRTLVEGTAEAEGFTMTMTFDAFPRNPFRVQCQIGPAPPPTSARHVVRLRDGVPTLIVPGTLNVTYHREPEEGAYLLSEWYPGSPGRPYDRQRSYLRVDGRSTPLANDGVPVYPLSIRTSGYMGFERLADRVPRGYGLGAPARPELANVAP